MLTLKQRNSICQRLEPALGEENAETLMAHLEDIVTKEFVTGQLSNLRGEMQAEFSNVRDEMRTEFFSVRREITELRGEMTTGFEHVVAEMRKELNNVVSGSIKWAIAISVSAITLAVSIVGVALVLRH